MLAIATALSCAAPAQAGAAFFLRIHYEPTTGKVGYHMISHILDYDSDNPGGALCTIRVSGEEFSGALPPGLHSDYESGVMVFEETPSEPGDWEVPITLHHVRCMTGPDQTDYGDRTFTVHFHFDGDAPRGVN